MKFLSAQRVSHSQPSYDPIRMFHLFLLGFAQHFFKEFVIDQFAFGNILAILNEVDRVSARNLLRVEGAEPKVSLAHHVGGQPVSVGVLCLIPEEFLLVSDTVDGHDQAAREEIGKGPANPLHLRIEKGKVKFVAFELVVDQLPRLLEFVASLVFTIHRSRRLSRRHR